MKRFINIGVTLILLAALLGAGVLVRRNQETRKGAAGETEMFRIEFKAYDCDPGNMKIGEECKMSVLVYGPGNEPMFEGFDYQWSMSSVNSVATLTKTEGKISSLIGKREGMSDMLIIAKPKYNLGVSEVVKGVKVRVSGGIRECVDSDGGRNYEIKGTTSNGLLTEIDKCDYCTMGECGVVRENFCENNKLGWENYFCGSGKHCMEGACVLREGCKVIDGVIRVTPVGGVGECHNIQEAVDVAYRDRRTTISLSEGDFLIDTGSEAIPGLVIDKPVSIVGILGGKTRIIVSSYLRTGILLKKTGKYLSRQELLDNRVDFSFLTITGASTGEMIKAVDRLAYFNRVNIEALKYPNNADYSLVNIDFNFQGYGFPANNYIFRDSVVGVNAPYYAIKVKMYDRTFGLSIISTEMGRLEVQGPIRGDERKVDTLAMVIIDGSQVKGSQFSHCDLTVRRSILGKTNGTLAGLSANSSICQLENNTIVGGDYGLSIGTFGNYRSWRFKNNIIASNNRVGVYIVDRPNSTGILEFKNNLVWENNPNYGDTGGNPPLLSDQTGVNGNISANPNFGEDYCLMPGSPAIGSGEGGINMGAKGECKNLTPTPTPGSITCKSCQSGVPAKNKGNASKADGKCDTKVDLSDFETWRREAFDESGLKDSDKSIKKSSWSADFDCDQMVTMFDFGIWSDTCYGVGGNCRLK